MERTFSAVAAAGVSASRPRLRIVPRLPLRIADVAALHGDPSGVIRTYLDAKTRFLATDPTVDHHVIVPGPSEFQGAGRHEIPLGARALTETLLAIAPDVVVLHDASWAPVAAIKAARRAGARVVLVRHASTALEAAALPGPFPLHRVALRVWLRSVAGHADAVMSSLDVLDDCGRAASIPLRLGVDAAFRPRSGRGHRGDHVLYVGRLARGTGVLDLLDVAARSPDPWPLRLVGSGPLDGRLRARAEALGIDLRVSFRPYVRDPEWLARAYTTARCVVLPGRHEGFGLVALEAAATGAPVVVCRTAPAAGSIGALGHRFEPDDPRGLDAAIAAAREAEPDRAAAMELAWRSRWPRVFALELAAMRDLVR